MIPPKKSPSNPLLAPASTFSLQDSFGPQPALLVPSANPASQPANSGASGFLGDDTPATQNQLQSSFNLSSAEMNVNLPPIPPAVNPAPPSQTPTPSLSTVSSTSSLTSLGQQNLATVNLDAPQAAPSASPAPGVFLLPGAKSGAPPAGAPPTSFAPSGLSSARKSRYVPPPGMTSTGSQPMAPMPPASNVNQAGPPPSFTPISPQAGPPSSTDTFLGQPPTASFPPPTAQAYVPNVPEVAHHWFYQVCISGQEQWKPFTMIDSVAMEDVFKVDENAKEPIPTDGGRYDAHISERKKFPVFWKEEPLPIRRCSWFYKSNLDGRWSPYSEEISAKLEKEYVSAFQSGQWNRR